MEIGLQSHGSTGQNTGRNAGGAKTRQPALVIENTFIGRHAIQCDPKQFYLCLPREHAGDSPRGF